MWAEDVTERITFTLNGKQNVIEGEVIREDEDSVTVRTRNIAGFRIQKRNITGRPDGKRQQA